MKFARIIFPFLEALQSAQKKGYAEADPSNDVDGYDAFYKIVILTELLFGQRPDWEGIQRKGIREISLNHIRLADSFGHSFEACCFPRLSQGELKIDVEPKVVPEEHPLYSVEGVDNAVVITGDLVGQLKLQGPGAGKLPTASAIIEDLVNVFNASVHHSSSSEEVKVLKDIDDEAQIWSLIGNTVDPLTGVTIIEDSIQNQGEFITARLVEATGKEINKLKEKNQDLTVYPFSGSPVQPIKKAFVSA